MRIIKSIMLLLVISLVSTGIGVSAAEDTERSASVVSFEGDVSILNAGAEKAQAPYEGLILDQGTRIITGKDASVVLQIDTDKEVIVGEKSYVTIEELTIDEGKEKTGFRLLAGKLWSSIKKKLQIGESYEIRTPNAIMGARGTKFSVAYAEEFEPGNGQAISDPQTELTVVEGVVAAKVKTIGSSDEEKEASADVKQGEKVQLNQMQVEADELLVEAIDYLAMDLFTIDAVLQDLKNNPDDYEDVVELRETLEAVRPEVEAREAAEEAVVQPPIGNVVYDDNTAELPVLVPVVSASSGGSSSSSSNSSGSTTISVTEVTLDQSELTFKIGDSPQVLTWQISPSNATDTSVTWHSNDTDIATIDASGLVTAEAVGSTDITITTVDGGFTATCTVSVNQISVEAINIFEETIELHKEETRDLWYAIAPGDADDKGVTWTSENPEIVTVDDAGLVTAVAFGSSKVTVTTNDGDFEDFCTVTVSPIPVESINIIEEAVGASKGDVFTLDFEILPGNAENQTVTWSSTDPAIASVDPSTGLVTAVTDGAIQIILSMTGGYTDTCDVVVDPILVDGVTLNVADIEVLLDETYDTLSANVSPAEASIMNVTWSSADTSIATVDATGKVTGVGVGNTTITVTTVDGGKTANCAVTVNPIALTDLDINIYTMTLDPGSTETLIAAYTPSNTTYKGVVWESTDTEVATVSPSGLVTAVASGDAIIIATSVSNEAQVEACSVHVNTISVSGITISASNLPLEIGEVSTLGAQVTPLNADEQGVTWSSDNPAIASVHPITGEVTAVDSGTAIITVESLDGNFTATCTVEVGQVAVTSVSITAPAMSVPLGDYIQLTADVMPANASNQNVLWSSSSTQYATVDSNSGMVYGNSKGEVTITATSVDGDFIADYNLYVVEEVFAWGVKDVEAKDNDGDGYVDEFVIETYTDVLAYDNTTPLVSNFFGEMSFRDEDIDIQGKIITLTLVNNTHYGTGDFGFLYIPNGKIICQNYEIYLPYVFLEEAIRPIVEAAVKVRADNNRGNLLDLTFSERMNIDRDVDGGFEIVHIDSNNDDGRVLDITGEGNAYTLQLVDCRVGDIIKVTDKNYDKVGNRLVIAEFEMQRDINGLRYWVKLIE